MERNRGGRPRHPDVLTPAEWRVLDALREGGTNAEIAARLGLSLDTVKSHISNMLAKLELRDRRALAAWRPDAPRRRLGGVLALPAALWSVGRPLAWVGAGVATLAGVAVVVVALVALEGIVEGDGEPAAAVRPPPTTSTPAAAPAAPGSCATPDDPTCIHAVYIGAPGDYRQVVDVPSAMLLSGGPGGTYRVDAGLEVTVVTAARLPAGWTRFYLEPVTDRRSTRLRLELIPPVGTTYTFTVSDDAPAATTVTYDLKAAKPFVRPRPDGKPHIGATVVETEFEVKDCSSGIAVTNPDDEHRARGGLRVPAGPPRHHPGDGHAQLDGRQANVRVDGRHRVRDATACHHAQPGGPGPRRRAVGASGRAHGADDARPQRQRPHGHAPVEAGAARPT